MINADMTALLQPGQAKVKLQESNSGNETLLKSIV
ncbi:hypothetical protein AM2010_2190 [Pelagerythrobacter marensis]|uniref:Uncharacterized protein n=1 Tax=Pelagerythrobacter marensis TaxID=543877 RepID=A0A0G3XCC8_9SPHN|nr:hypothetical protein AM2010_2190 [Pelagerythrobacter marensis]